jgi:hypothetical protein
MIDSWKSLIHTLDQMRQLQRNPRVAKNPDMLFRLKRAEAEVDFYIDQKLKEWAGRESPELVLEGTHRQ